MKKQYVICLISFIINTHYIHPKVPPASEIKVWLELDVIKEKVNAHVKKYTNLQAELTQNTNTIFEDSIQTAKDLGDSDQNAALAIYHEMQKLKNKTDQSNLNIQEVNKKYKELSLYINKQIKELTDARRKHLQFP